MIKAGVAYYTRTGHSRRIAETVAQALSLPVKTITDLPEPTELMFIVGAVYFSRSAPQMLKAVRRLSNRLVRRAVLITTSGSGRGQKETRRVLAERGIMVEDEEFICRGKILCFNRGRPSEQDIRDAVAFAQRMLEKYNCTPTD